MPASARILVVDDDPGVREYLEDFLGRRSYRVFTAASGEEALRTLSKTQPDLVTLDIAMPGMSGVETLRELRKQAPAVPVIVISGHGPARNIAEWRRLGATNFLRKPFTNEQLELVIRQAVESR